MWVPSGGSGIHWGGVLKCIPHVTTVFKNQFLKIHKWISLLLELLNIKVGIQCGCLLHIEIIFKNFKISTKTNFNSNILSTYQFLWSLFWSVVVPCVGFLFLLIRSKFFQQSHPLNDTFGERISLLLFKKQTKKWNMSWKALLDIFRYLNLDFLFTVNSRIPLDYLYCLMFPFFKKVLIILQYVPLNDRDIFWEMHC